MRKIRRLHITAEMITAAEKAGPIPPRTLDRFAPAWREALNASNVSQTVRAA